VPDGRRVLVTGGAGFIGSVLVDRLLAEGDRVVVVDDLSTGKLENLAEARAHADGGFEFQRLDLNGGSLGKVVERHRPEVIFHLAAQINVRVSVEEPIFDARTNVLGTIEVLEAARRHSVDKVVFATSGGTIYGEPDESELPLGEDRPLEAHSPYGASKIAGEKYLRTYQALYGLDWTSLALTNVYGPRQDPAGEAGVVAIFAEQMLAGEPAVIFGDGDQTRDFVHVDDVVHAFVLAGAAGGGRRFNIGTSRRTSVNELFQTMAAVIGYDQDPVRAPARAGELRHNAVDPTRAGEDLGWEPFTDLREGLEGTIEWTRSALARSST
jgi:UDP-glucose 4-epimerase